MAWVLLLSLCLVLGLFVGTASAAPPTVTVAQGTDPGRPTAKVFVAPGASRVIDQLSLSATANDASVRQVVVRGRDTAPNLLTDVSSVRLFLDNGTTAGQWDAGDAQVGTAQTFSGNAELSTATFYSASGLFSITRDTTVKVWIVYTAGAGDGRIVGSQVNNGDVVLASGSVTAFSSIVSAGSGQTAQIDGAAPTADTSDPLTNDVLTSSPKMISGTASDGSGSGVAAVTVSIRRSSDGRYWSTGTGWTPTETWNPASGTTNWTYSWPLDAGQDGTNAQYTITARAVDAVANTGTDVTPVTGVRVDNVGPTMVQAVPVDPMTLDVTWSESVAAGSVSAADFSIDGLFVTGAVVQADPRVVRLSTTSQIPSQAYTVTSTADAVSDLAGNTNPLTSASFFGSAGTEQRIIHPDSVSSGAYWTSDSDTVSDLAANDSLYVHHTSASEAGVMDLTMANPGYLGTLQSVDMVVVAKASTAARTLEVAPVLGASSGATQTISGIPASAQSYTFYSIARPGGGSWTWQDLRDLTVRLRAASAGVDGTSLDVGEVYFRITYEPLAGGILSVVQGSDPGRPASKVYSRASGVRAVDELVVSASNGSVTISEIGVRGLDTSATLTTDVGQVRLFEDDGDGAWSAGDVQLGGTTSFPGAASGSKATFGGLTLSVTDGASRSIWVVYSLGAGARDGHAVGARVSDGDIVMSAGAVDGFTDVVSANGGQTIQIDEASPTVSVAAPDASSVVTGTVAQVAGTSFDPSGSGVESVEVRIERSDGSFWSGSGWTGSEAWNTADGTTDWSYAWQLDPGQTRLHTFTVTARATDAVDTVGISSAVGGIQVDNVGPYIASARSVDATHVDLTFSETLGSFRPQDFSVEGLGVLGAEVIAASTVRLTTSEQSSSGGYTARCTQGGVTDVYGNANASTNAAFPGYGSETEAPSIPASVTASPGVEPSVIATVTWLASTDDVGVAGYRVYRSVSLVGWYRSIGTTTALSFADVTGVPGQIYYYKVAAFDRSGRYSALSLPAGPVTSLWKRSPHAGPSCRDCHQPHVATTPRGLMRQTGGQPGQASLCLECHDTSGASTDIKNSPTDSFALASGHRLEESSTADLADACSSCHAQHRDNGVHPVLVRPSINGTTVAEADNSWCEACHNDDDDWYGQGYPAASAPTRDASGYPVLGTFPGPTSARDTSSNAHARIPASVTGRQAGACLYCHAAHRGPNAYDGLRLTYRPSSASSVASDQADGTYAALCLYCHGDTVPSELTTAPTNIERFVTRADSRAGHRIKTAGGTLPVGAPLPCYDCHSTHGSTRGNASMLSDMLGTDLSVETSATTRRFCLSCHSSSNGKVWDSGAADYRDVTTTETVEGLKRDGSDGSRLRLPSEDGHGGSDIESCGECHGNSYEPDGYNVHDPKKGTTESGGRPCYECHAKYQEYMEDGTGAATGSKRTEVYHHVMGGNYSGGAYQDGDFAPGPSGTYSASGTGEVFCVSCHVDHDKFDNEFPSGANLRDSFRLESVTATDTDFSASLPFGGVCTDCHSVSLEKDTANQASSVSSSSSDATTRTPRIDAATYPGAVHNYAVASTFSDSTFRGDCSKCHNDEDRSNYKEYQIGSPEFGTHFSSIRRLLSPLGAPLVDPLPSTDCYGCHAEAGSYSGAKQVAGRDGYGSAGATMSALSERVYAQYEVIPGPNGSRHPVDDPGTNTMKCASCHNAHVVKATQPVVDPDDTYDLAPYATTSDEVSFCLECHDGSVPAYQSDDTTFVPSTVGIAPSDAAIMNKATNASRGHSTANGSIGASEVLRCQDCHDNHGSSYRKLLGSYDATTSSNRIDGQAITGNDNSVCAACHSGASGYPVESRDASGYPVDGRWPGSAMYGTSFVPSAHTGNGHLNAVWPGKTYPAGDCKHCHEVHGTDNRLDELRTEDAAGATGVYGYSATDSSFCLNCHDGSGSTTDIKRYYPVSAGGTGTGPRAGHQVKTDVPGATLKVGQAVPCYDCHNVHGSGAAYGLQVGSIGDSAGEIDLSSDQGVRRFCFACHTTSDTLEGWSGSAYVAVGTSEFEGFRRDGSDGSLVKLPSVFGHRKGDAESCYACHLDDYSTSASYNVHNPARGISDGGEPCYACHQVYRQYMEDDTGSEVGANNAEVYHHVMGSSGSEGDAAPGSGAHQTSTTDVFCTSCHSDHNYFNSDKAANLRRDIGDSSGAQTSNTDYSTTTHVGICTSCHGSVLARQGAGTEQKDAGTALTPKVPAGAGSGQYGASAHSYDATSGFTDGSTFKANCSKCHDDENQPSYKFSQSSVNRFGTHWSAERALLSALGLLLVDPLGNTECFACHTGGGAGTDVYGVAPMTQLAKTTQAQYELSGSVHPIAPSNGNSVVCANCHNPHVVSATERVVDPSNTYSTMAYATEDQKTTFCLRCHRGGTLPTYVVNGTTFVPATVTIASADTTAMDKAPYLATGHSAANGSIGASEVQSCAACHENHGSRWPKLLGVYEAATASNTIAGKAITGNDNSVCDACHDVTSTGYPALSRDAGGYPSNGRWPGTDVYTSARGIHRGETVRWPGTTYVGGYCNNCHDVHGTRNTYDELRAIEGTTAQSYGPTTSAFCFACHGANAPETTVDMKPYYPTSVGGTATQGSGTYYGHKTLSVGTLPVGSPLPCYDCHDPHGSAETSSGLLVVTMTGSSATTAIGDQAGELDLGTSAGVRRFCFTCHTTAGATSGQADTTSYGWNGASMASVPLGALFEGIERSTRDAVNRKGLKLSPVTNAHYRDDVQSCFDCHGNDYSSPTSNNVHNPGMGGSNGGLDCMGCHGAGSAERFDKMVGDTSTYHHVLDDATPGLAPFAGPYPTSPTTLSCVSCHTDHDRFNDDKAKNLRLSVSDSSGEGTNTDFIAGGWASPGICMSCHSMALTKSTAQKTAGASSRTLTLSAENYAVSVHSYPASVTYGDGSVFKADCSKCHDDEQDSVKSYQTSTFKIGTHQSAEARLLKALGVNLTALGLTTEENLCYSCHSGGAAGNDSYGARPMTARSKGIAAQFAKTSRHNVAGYSGIHKSDEYDSAPTSVSSGTTNDGMWGAANVDKHVECDDCHDSHEVQAGSYEFAEGSSTANPRFRRASTPVPISNANKGVWGVDIQGSVNGTWAGSGTYGSPGGVTYNKIENVSYEWQLCLKCHSVYAWGKNTPPAIPSGQNKATAVGGSVNAAGTMQDVGATFNPKNFAYHPVFTVGRNQPDPNIQMYAGSTPAPSTNTWNTSTYRRVINGTSTGWGLSNAFVDGWLSTSMVTCSDCHFNDDWSASAPHGPHGSSKKWLLRGLNTGIKVQRFNSAEPFLPNNVSPLPTGAENNYCNNCHRSDVYSLNGGNGNTPVAYNLSRMWHGSGGEGPAANCLAAGSSPQLQSVGCHNCHGARTNDGTVAAGAIHGSSMGKGDGSNALVGGSYPIQNGTLVGDEMGKHFMNGASWSAHKLGAYPSQGQVIGCATNTSNDNFGSCTSHKYNNGYARSATPHWDYD